MAVGGRCCVARRPVLMIFRAREVVDGGSKENSRDGETDLVALHGKSDLHVD